MISESISWTHKTIVSMQFSLSTETNSNKDDSILVKLINYMDLRVENDYLSKSLIKWKNYSTGS